MLLIGFINLLINVYLIFINPDKGAITHPLNNNQASII